MLWYDFINMQFCLLKQNECLAPAMSV